MLLFINQTVHEHTEHQQKFHKNLLELKQASQAFNILIPAVHVVEDLVQVLQQVDIPIKKDFIQLMNSFQSIKKNHEKNIERFEHYRDETIAKHAAAVGIGIGRIKQLFASRNKLNSVKRSLNILEKKREDCEKTWELINKYQFEYFIAIPRLIKQLEVQVNAKIHQLQRQSVQLIQEYKERIGRVKSEHESDTRVLGMYAFIMPLMVQLEQIRSMINTAKNTHNEYILNRSSVSLHKVMEGLQSYIFRDLVEAYTFSVSQLEIDEASLTIEEKLPYSLSSITPAFEGANYMPYMPGRVMLNTTYLGSYTISVILVGALYASIWPSWVDRLKPADKAIKVQGAVKVEQNQAEPKSKDIGTATIVAYEMNVRNKPDISGEIVGSVKKGSTFKVQEERNGWILIGENKWISSKEEYVSLVRHPQ